jgi:hypothetical protein
MVLKELLSKERRRLCGVAAHQGQNLLKAPLNLLLDAKRKLCPKIAVAYGRLQPDTTEAFLCNMHARGGAMMGGARGWISSLSKFR